MCENVDRNSGHSAGNFQWTGVPAGNLFFLVVGTDGAGTESGWGFDSNIIERNGTSASGECGVVTKDASNSCP